MLSMVCGARAFGGRRRLCAEGTETTMLLTATAIKVEVETETLPTAVNDSGSAIESVACSPDVGNYPTPFIDHKKQAAQNVNPTMFAVYRRLVNSATPHSTR